MIDDTDYKTYLETINKRKKKCMDYGIEMAKKYGFEYIYDKYSIQYTLGGHLSEHISNTYISCDCPFDSKKLNLDQACGDTCINRRVYTECLHGRCPSGVYCQNQRIQRGGTHNLAVIEHEKKGKCLIATKPIKGGRLVIEYMGEVIDQAEFAERTSSENASKATSSKHHYYMEFNEYIVDSTYKGNISRFINHSCSPTCEMQVWVVNGKSRVGIFAIQDMAANEEVTFDYQMEYYNDDLQTCYCGSVNCKGTIGKLKPAPIGTDVLLKEAFVKSNTDTICDYQSGIFSKVYEKVFTSRKMINTIDQVKHVISFLCIPANNLFDKAIGHLSKITDVKLLSFFLQNRGLYALNERILMGNLSARHAQLLVDFICSLPFKSTNVLISEKLGLALDKLKALLIDKDDDLQYIKRLDDLLSHINNLPDTYVIPKEQSFFLTIGKNSQRKDNADSGSDQNKQNSFAKDVEIAEQLLKKTYAAPDIPSNIETTEFTSYKRNYLPTDMEFENNRVTHSYNNYERAQHSQHYLSSPRNHHGLSTKGLRNIKQDEEIIYTVPALNLVPTPAITTKPATPKRIKKSSITTKLMNLYANLKDPEPTKLITYNKQEYKAAISSVVLKELKKYKSPTAKIGRIESSEDFKHLARKFTHSIYEREMLKRTAINDKSNSSVDSIVYDVRREKKLIAFINDSMDKYGSIYKRKLDQ